MKITFVIAACVLFVCIDAASVLNDCSAGSDTCPQPPKIASEIPPADDDANALLQGRIQVGEPQEPVPAIDPPAEEEEENMLQDEVLDLQGEEDEKEDEQEQDDRIFVPEAPVPPSDAPAEEQNMLQDEALDISNETVSSVAQAWVDAHNMYRCMHGASQVRWDKSLAAAAYSWIKRHGYTHASMSQTGCGENLAWASYYTGSASNAKAATKMWYNEVNSCRWPVRGFSGSTGHFTAMIWKEVKSIGCAFYNKIGICRYKNKRGSRSTMPNMGGYFQQNVKPRIKSQSQCKGGGGGRGGASKLSKCGATKGFCYGYKSDGTWCYLTHDGKSKYIKQGDGGYRCSAYNGYSSSTYCKGARR